MASTSTLTHQDTLTSHYLSSSLSSLSRSRTANTLVVRTYKQATALYLTKRFAEALETLEPIITAPASLPQPDDVEDSTNGVDGEAAPVVQSSKGTRTKVWVFYLSLLHAIIELGPEEGKTVFGSAKWRALAAKARDGTVWAEIVQAGYAGVEGDVDADVVVNLATLLLGHMPTQKLNQQSLEAWLASAGGEGGGQHHVAFGADDAFGPGTGSTNGGGASSPKALATRLKILELYTLHVLPANEEWQYAREFIEVNDTLDEERREVFLQALQQLRDERDGTAARERALGEQREREMKEVEEQRRQEEVARERQQKEAETKRQRDGEATEKQQKATSSVKSEASATSTSKPVQTTSAPKPSPTARPSPNKPATKKSPLPPSRPPPTTLYHRASSALSNIQQTISHASKSMTGGNGTMAMLRLLTFIMAFVLLIARRDLRVRVKRMVGEGWGKVRKTVGMGVKVSYI